MDISKLIRISEILEDGAITPSEGKELIEGVVVVLEKVRPQLKKWWFRVMLDGIKVSLMELKEHLEDIGK
jgi:hypothetical protein